MGKKRNGMKSFSGLLAAIVLSLTLNGCLPLPGECQETTETGQTETEKVAEEAAEKAIEKVAEKAVEEAAQEASIKARRPEEWRGPTEIHFLVFVLDIDGINDVDQNFTTNVYLRLKWKDTRLADPSGYSRQIPLEQAWHPRVLLANRQGLVTRSLPEVLEVLPNGTVTYHQRYTGMLSQPLSLKDFPMDQHQFLIQFAAAGYTSDEIRFIPGEGRGLIGGAMADELSLPDWEILGYEALNLPYSPIKEIDTAGFGFRFEAKRYSRYYFWQVVLPLSVVVCMSWSAFWVKAEHLGVRIGIATSSILTLIANRFVIASLLPRLPYMTRMDYFTMSNTVLVFLALLLVVITSLLYEKGAHAQIGRANRINRSARIILPTAYLTLLAWFVFG